MSNETLWRTSSLEGKWMNGKGDVVARRIEYYQKTWLDLRINNIQDGKNQPTRHGVRLTVEQLKELIPRLVDFVNDIEDEREAAKRAGWEEEKEIYSEGHNSHQE